MEDDRKKIQEPFDPKNTPGPPQRNPDEEPKRAPGSDEEKPGGPANSQQEKKEKSHLLNEETEIDDETTI